MTSLFIVVDWLQPTDFCTFHILLYPPVRIQPFFLKEKIMAGHWFQFQNKTNKSSAGQLVCKKSWSMFFEKESRCNKATNIVTDKEKKKKWSVLSVYSFVLYSASRHHNLLITSSRQTKKVSARLSIGPTAQTQTKGDGKKKQTNQPNESLTAVGGHV